MKTKFMKVLSVLLAMALLATTGIGALADGYIEIEDPGTLVGQLDDKDVIKVNAGETASVTIVAKTGLKLNAFEGYWGWGKHMTFTGMTSEVLDKSIEGNYWGNEGKLIWVDLTFPTQENTKAGDKLLTANFDTTGMAAGDYRVSFTLEVLGHEIADQNGEPVQVLFDGEYTLEWSVHVHNDLDNDHMCDACEAEMSKHDWKQTGIKDNGDGTHTVSYTCELNASHTMSDEPEEHTYNQEDGTKCICGAEKPAAPAGLKGDVDLSGEVDLNDLVALAQHIGESVIITNSESLANAEVTGEGDVDLNDLVKIAQYIGETIDSLD